MSQRQDLVVEASREHLVENDLKQVKKYRLNHCATEFVSSESSVEGESDIQSEEEAEGENSPCIVSEEGSPLKAKAGDERPAMQGRGSTTGMPNEHHDQAYGNGYAWGWESPQGVLPATPHGVDPTRYMSVMRPGSPPNPMASAPDCNGEEEEEGAQSPSGNAASRQSAQHMMHQYSTGYHLPYHGAPYPVYGYPQEHGERSSSPQPMFPGGGSPPLAPGFFSVPVGISSSGGSSPPAHPMMMYGCSPPNSLGSSPPGSAHYYFMPPMHPVHQSHEFDSRYDVSHHLGNMSISSASSKTSAPGKPGEARASARIARSNRAGGAYNPQDFEFNVEEAKVDNDEARKTIMIRNIPNKYSQAVMLGMLEKAGLGGTFDFFYLPIDFRNKCGLGYAFINFLSAKHAAKLYEEFHNKRWDEFNSKKVCEIKYARVQGRDNLIQHFKTAKFPSQEQEFQPLIYIHQRTISGKLVVDQEPKTIHEYLLEEEGGPEGDAKEE